MILVAKYHSRLHHLLLIKYAKLIMCMYFDLQLLQFQTKIVSVNSQEKIVTFTMYCLLYDEQCEYIHYCKFYKTNTSNGNCNVNFTLLLFTIVE